MVSTFFSLKCEKIVIQDSLDITVNVFNWFLEYFLSTRVAMVHKNNASVGFLYTLIMKNKHKCAQLFFFKYKLLFYSLIMLYNLKKFKV